MLGCLYIWGLILGTPCANFTNILWPYLKLKKVRQIIMVSVVQHILLYISIYARSIIVTNKHFFSPPFCFPLPPCILRAICILRMCPQVLQDATSQYQEEVLASWWTPCTYHRPCHTGSPAPPWTWTPPPPSSILLPAISSVSSARLPIQL